MGERKQRRALCFQKGKSRSQWHVKLERARFGDQKARSGFHGYNGQRFRFIARVTKRKIRNINQNSRPPELS